jgi:iron complex transport system permease protein
VKPARRALAWSGLAVAVVVALVVGVALGGASGIGPSEALGALLGLAEVDDPARATLIETLVFEIRLPRVVLLALAGAALAASGTALQAALQNPLCDPGLLGLSAGASLGAVLAYATGLFMAWPHAVPLAAFVGALVAIFAVYGIAHAAGPPTTATLLLTGVAIASFGSAVVSLVLLSIGDYRVHEVFAWLLGSAENRTWRHVELAVVPIALGLAGLFLSRRLVDALAMGDEHAQGIGVDLLRARALLFVLVSLAAGAAVSVLGPIGFVGLMVPHLVRPVAGAAARVLLPASALAGAGFLVLCDTIARSLSAQALVPVGVVTSMAGVVFFLALLHRIRRG